MWLVCPQPFPPYEKVLPKHRDPALRAPLPNALLGLERITRGLAPLEVGVPKDAEVQFFEGGKGADKPAWFDNFVNMTAKERCETIML